MSNSTPNDDISPSNSRNQFYRYALSCNYKKYDKLVDFLIIKLQENHFKLLTFDEHDQKIILLSYNNEDKFLQEAQNSKIRKTFSTNKTPSDSINLDSLEELNLPSQVIEQEKRKNFSVDIKNQFIPDNYYNNLYKHILNDKKDDNENSENWGYGLFTESEMIYLEIKLMRAIKIDLKTQQEFFELVKNNEILSKNIDDMEKVLSNDKELLSVFDYFEIISDQTPIHISNFRQNILKEVLVSLRCPYRNIRSYFGDKVAIYYAWTYHYTRLLIFPALVSVLIVILNLLAPEWLANSVVTFYALAISIWSQIFLIYFSRKCSEISIEWDNYTEEYDRDNTRKEFQGEWRKSAITGKDEKFYPNKKRLVKYLLTILCSLPMIFLSIFANIIFLNLNGFIDPKIESIFEIKFLGELTLPGALLDKNSFKNTIFCIVYGIILSKINGYYDEIAKVTSDWENHRVHSNHENSMIIKRFAFEFFNYFLSFVYLGFVIFDMDALKKSMASLYVSNQISRVLTELLIPNIINLLKGTSNIRDTFSKGNKLDKIQGSEITKKEILDQFNAEIYHTYTDYLSLVLEFGNLVLFAECFPLAPLYLLIFNSLEMRVDIIGLCQLYRRPIPIRKRNIGSWKIILFFISCLSIFTNLFFILFAKSENKLSYLLGTNSTNKNNLFYFFILEHLVLIIIGFLNLLNTNVSEWVRLFLERREYRSKENKGKVL